MDDKNGDKPESVKSVESVIGNLGSKPFSATSKSSKKNDKESETSGIEDTSYSLQDRNINIADYQNMSGHEKVIDLIVKKDDVTWKTIILELVNSDMMDPWDVDIGMLTKEYLRIIDGLKIHDFRVSGKMVLAAAMLLKLKSVRLLEGDINELDRLLSSANDQAEENDLGIMEESLPSEVRNIDIHKLIPRTPQPRKRKVSIYDLVDALEKALEVKERRIMRRMPSLEIEYPRKRMDVSILMGHLYQKINSLITSNQRKVLFTDLMPSQSKEDKVITFIPLLHLTNSRKVDLEQDDHFGPIEVLINENTKLEDEINNEL